MRIHLAAGEGGCRLAVELAGAAVVVDALRASATVAALVAAGADDICVVREVEDAFAMRERWPDALLFGERGGVPPLGFDYGNSPREAVHACGRRVIFTTTTGAGRMLQAWGAERVLMGSVVNCMAVVQHLERCAAENVVLIPAGLMDDPDFDAQEDWTAAVYLASQLLAGRVYSGHVVWGEGQAYYEHYINRIETEGLGSLFENAPHAAKLRAVGMSEDIPLCAEVDRYASLAIASGTLGPGLLLRKGQEGQ